MIPDDPSNQDTYWTESVHVIILDANSKSARTKQRDSVLEPDALEMHY